MSETLLTQRLLLSEQGDPVMLTHPVDLTKSFPRLSDQRDVIYIP